MMQRRMTQPWRGMIVKKLIMAMATVFVLWTPSVTAEIVLSLDAAPGVDLSHVTVGQELEFQITASGGLSKEYPISMVGDLAYGPTMTAGFELVSASVPGHVPPYIDTLHVVLDFVIRVKSPGVASFDIDFGVTNSGSFLTNRYTHYIATNFVTFDVSPAAVPEPSTLVMTGLVYAAGLVVQRRRRSVA